MSGPFVTSLLSCSEATITGSTWVCPWARLTVPTIAPTSIQTTYFRPLMRRSWHHNDISGLEEEVADGASAGQDLVVRHRDLNLMLFAKSIRAYAKHMHFVL